MTMLFHSGFGPGVILRSPTVVNGEWEQLIQGSDTPGFDWEQLPQRNFPENRITYLVDGDRALNQYAEARIQVVDGHDGQPTHALYMEITREDPSTPEGTRVQYGIYPPADFTQCYARFWLKLQPNLATEILPPGVKKSRQFMEWKETGSPRSDFRMGLYIGRDPDLDPAALYWFTWAQFGDLRDSPTAWRVNSDAPVPVGEWCEFEVFWKLGVTDGRMVAKVNGHSIIDYTGRTQKDSGLYVWWPFKVYVGTDLASFGGRPIYQWVDDFELADAPPELR